MKRILSLLASALVLLALASSCELLEGTDPGKGGSSTEAAPKLEPKKTAVTSSSGSIFVAVTANGEWRIDLSFPSGGPEGWATMDPATGSGNKGDVRLRYEANTSTESRKVTLRLYVNGAHKASVTIEQLGVGQSELSVGGFKTDVAPVNWLELPATAANDGHTFYCHDMQGGGYVNKNVSGVRNWSFYWNREEHLSTWVAYPLNKSLIGSGTRTDEWGLDPLLPDTAQPHLIAGSYGGGWTRGHQIPSADRLNYKANVCTFYGTNMTPQNYDFNAGVWARLEAQVRKCAGLADTLYVVTGCVLEGSTQHTGGSSGFVITVPSAYFKALLYLSPNRSQYHKGYMAAGYYVVHSTSAIDDAISDHLMSIDALEQLTGIDFFVNLPSAVGEKVAAEIEAETPISWWR